MSAVEGAINAAFSIPDDCSGKYRAITPNDSADLPDGPCRSILAGSGGAAVLVDLTGTDVTVQLQAGYNPLACKRVKATGTSATDLVAIY